MKSLGVRYGFVQRSKGHTAARRSAYQRDRFVQGKNSTKLFFNLEEKHLHSGIAVPGNAEAWCSDAVELWERAALAEKRRDAVEARTLDLTLSRKLSEFTMIAICKSIANSFARLGIAVQFDVHISIAADGQHNPHAHFLLSTRKISGEGFDKYKCHDLDKIFSKGRGRFLRQNLATLINQYSTKYDGQPVVYAEKRVNERTPEPRLPRWRAKTVSVVI